jgi:hypothetical protein
MARLTWRQTGLVVLACTIFAYLAHARVSTEPVLLADDFDTGNTAGAAPIGWKIIAPPGTSVRVVSASVTEPSSGSNCVELTDNSSTGRPEMYRDFTPSESGKASAAFKLKSTATAHSALQLRTANGGNLCSVIFAASGLMRYEHADGSANSTTKWVPGQWQTVEIEWFDDFTFNASLGGAQFIQRAHFVTNGVPGRIHIIGGYGTATNRIGYVDDVKVVDVEVH